MTHFNKSNFENNSLSSRPFRLLDENGKKTWGKVNHFDKGKVNAEVIF